MNNDMFIDPDTFDFSLLMEDETPSNDPVQEEETNEFYDDSYEENEEYEESGDEESGDTEEDKFEKDISLQTFSENFDDIPDDLEFKIGGEVITKQFIAETVKTRNDIAQAEEELRTYINNTKQREEDISFNLSIATTEVEGRLKHVNNLLSDPESLTPQDLQKAYIAKSQLEKRYSELSSAVIKIREAEAATREQNNVMKIKQTDMSMRGEKDWRGIDSIRELAGYAQEIGLSQDLVLEGMSPALMKVLMNARRWESQQNTNKARIKESIKSQAPRSISTKKKPREVSQTKMSESTRRREYEKAMKAGDSAKMFSLLVD
ncbi:MAG: hypothetical protein ACRCSY_08525 [Cetobacterium sp.]